MRAAVLMFLAAQTVFAAPLEIQVTLVDGEAIGYATFQSHNQKVLANTHGIFMTHIRSRNEAYTAQQWRLSRSTDGGETFSTVYEATHGTNPPVIETDVAGNVYLMRADYVDGNAYLYRFFADRNFADPEVSVVPGAAAGKYAMAIDEARGVLYFFAHNNTFSVVGLDGVVRSSINLTQEGPDAYIQYPHLALDAEGTLHAPWTTQKKDRYLYWDILHIQSPDGGATWQTMQGAAIAPPVLADQHGPATLISSRDENDAHTWLSGFMAKGGKAHFFYMAQTEPRREHYIRYDIATGNREIDTNPEFKGDQLEIQSLDGFFTTRDLTAETPLYALGAFQGIIVCLISRDNGATWHDYAQSGTAYNVYALSGFRRLTADGYIIGSFTDSGASPSKVYFVKVKAE
ncbi:MAG: hypothetical protein AMXMBFR84_03720 [Candidatus Hydrogenedentota bacterium]